MIHIYFCAFILSLSNRLLYLFFPVSLQVCPHHIEEFIVVDLVVVVEVDLADELVDLVLGDV